MPDDNVYPLNDAGRRHLEGMPASQLTGNPEVDKLREIEWLKKIGMTVMNSLVGLRAQPDPTAKILATHAICEIVEAAQPKPLDPAE